MRFSVATKPKQVSPGVEIVLSAYNKFGSLKARHTWIASEEMSNSAKMVSVFEVGSGLKGAFRYTIEFLVPTITQNDDACTTCTDNAVRACGAGKVQSLSCEPDVNGIFSCVFICKDQVGGEEGGNQYPLEF